MLFELEFNAADLSLSLSLLRLDHSLFQGGQAADARDQNGEEPGRAPPPPRSPGARDAGSPPPTAEADDGLVPRRASTDDRDVLLAAASPDVRRGGGEDEGSPRGRDELRAPGPGGGRAEAAAGREDPYRMQEYLDALAREGGEDEHRESPGSRADSKASDGYPEIFVPAFPTRVALRSPSPGGCGVSLARTDVSSLTAPPPEAAGGAPAPPGAPHPGAAG